MPKELKAGKLLWGLSLEYSSAYPGRIPCASNIPFRATTRMQDSSRRALRRPAEAPGKRSRPSAGRLQGRIMCRRELRSPICITHGAPEPSFIRVLGDVSWATIAQLDVRGSSMQQRYSIGGHLTDAMARHSHGNFMRTRQQFAYPRTCFAGLGNLHRDKQMFHAKRNPMHQNWIAPPQCTDSTSQSSGTMWQEAILNSCGCEPVIGLDLQHASVPPPHTHAGGRHH